MGPAFFDGDLDNGNFHGDLDNGIFHGIFMGFNLGHNGDIIWSFASLRNGKSPIFSR